MIRASIKMTKGSQCWDQLALTIVDDESNISTIVRINSQDETIELNNQLNCMAIDNDFSAPVTINNMNYAWSKEICTAVLSVTDNWMNDYMIINCFDVSE